MLKKRLKQIRNFEYKLQEKIAYNHSQLITETQGVNEEIPKISDYLWHIYSANELFEINDEDIHCFVGFTIHIDSEFCDSIAQLSIIEGQGASCFQHKKATYNQKTKKLENVHILIFLKNLNDKEEFIDKMSHELMHAYDLCMLYDKNVGNIPNGQKIVNKRYDFNRENMLNSQYKGLEYEICEIIYLMFNDEQSSFFESLYAYIISNKKINRQNYHKYLEKTRIYQNIQDLETALTNCATLSFDKKKFIGYIYKRYIYSSDISNKQIKMTDERAFKRFISKLEYTVKRLYEKLYRVVGYALDKAELNDENRKSKVAEHYSYDKFKPLKGWLFEKH